MDTKLKSHILSALFGSTSRNPVDTRVLVARGYEQADVEAALMALYQEQQICCCKIIKGGMERVVWWMGGAGQVAPISFRTYTSEADE